MFLALLSACFADDTNTLRKSAEKGDANAQLDLGLAYADGNGMPKNLVEAHAWLDVANVGSDEIIPRHLDAVEKQMTKDQIAEAAKRAKSLVATIKK